MRRWVWLVLCVSTRAWAEDYRACKELFVSPLVSKVAETNASGAPWDEGSLPDPELTAMVADAEGATPAVIGPRLEDSTVLAWNSLPLAETRSGAWLPVGVGGSLQLMLTDQDDGPSDFIGAFSVTVPESLAQTGTAFVQATSQGAQPVSLTLRISASDGKRGCAGMEKVGPARYELPAPTFSARVDAALFEKIRSAQKCKAGSTPPECVPERYDVLYTHELVEGAWLTVVSGGGQAGAAGKFHAIAWGVDPATRQVAFLGRCDTLKTSPSVEGAVACVQGSKATFISLEKGKPRTRAANARELEALKGSP
ncbi:hypothetical protein LZ198_08175 [Myxococcus sp. K15C18031901]|uniref:hypothetical protein n=1 Tax=Myxococcus dinghuensis TaxID=2906761 RepID=UPI0020A81A9D|nr:hypothetical protein [Myxococcus dinghuensis]MCP3098849.1 hypothetical protein [Myxococcus dinghuensis]